MIEQFDGHKPEISPTAFVHKTAVIIGKVKIGDNVSIWPNVVIRGDVNEIVIGDDTNIQDGTVVHVDFDNGVYIGKAVTVGHSAVIHGTKIGDNCLIGMNAVTLESEIGNNCLIAAGAVLSPGKKIADNSVLMGIPAKEVKKMDDEGAKKIAENAKIYIELARKYGTEK